MWVYLARFLLVAVVPLALKVLSALGIGTATYFGIWALFSWAKSYIFANIGGLPAEMVTFIGMLNIDVAINIIFSAFTIRLTISGINQGTDGMKRLVFGGLS